MGISKFYENTKNSPHFEKFSLRGGQAALSQVLLINPR